MEGQGCVVALSRSLTGCRHGVRLCHKASWLLRTPSSCTAAAGAAVVWDPVMRGPYDASSPRSEEPWLSLRIQLVCTLLSC